MHSSKLRHEKRGTNTPRPLVDFLVLHTRHGIGVVSVGVPRCRADQLTLYVEAGTHAVRARADRTHVPRTLRPETPRHGPSGRPGRSRKPK